jgi:hypothetical protein
MHKPFYLLFFIYLANSAVARPVVQLTPTLMSSVLFEDPTYSEVVDCGSVSQADLFRRSRIWILQSAPEDKLLLNDRETGDLVSHATLSFNLPRSDNFSGGAFMVSYVLTVECANRKYRSSVTNIQVFQSGSTRTTSLESFKLQNEPATKLFQAELDRLIKTRLEQLKLYVRDYKAF